jgi:hypothetical protein
LFELPAAQMVAWEKEWLIAGEGNHNLEKAVPIAISNAAQPGRSAQAHRDEKQKTAKIWHFSQYGVIHNPAKNGD